MSDDIERFPTESGQAFYEQRKASWDIPDDPFKEYMSRITEQRRQEEMKTRLKTLFAQPGVEYAPAPTQEEAPAPTFSRSERRKFAKCKHKRIKKTEHMDKVYLACQDCGYTVSRNVTNFDRA
ncbi:hypothetical protein SEA_DRE3_51 [Gordonia phage Dre3]|uniref:Uncharacterized protein n=1 Tax=Gordonia phage Gibbous TaxID=2652405 RepID=A0A5J6T5W0_9CAUD|nr:hypothetical protein QLQ74_gp51 [Gordonia phage Gibbous]QFG05127.1 hypothetical protein SEA_GIBBOUS_51 [Gordonia phage Gibbous]QRI45980.1 hypothetical protein SEA_DRE3_51 [Gordonia phage Dre3]